VLGLVLASGICGLLLGHYFRVYVCFPIVLVLVVAAYFVGQTDGLMTGVLAFVFGVIALQICFLIGASVRVFTENFAPKPPRKTPCEEVRDVRKCARSDRPRDLNSTAISLTANPGTPTARDRESMQKAARNPSRPFISPRD